MRTLNIHNYKDLFYKSSLGVFTSTIEGRYIETNDAFVHLLGYSDSNELLKLDDISSAIYSIEGERDKLIKELLEKNDIITHETSFNRKDKSQIPVRINLKLIDEENKEKLVIGLVEDISPHMSTQKQILREKQTLASLIENLPDYIYFKSSDGTILIANKPFRELLKTQAENSAKDSSSSIIKEIFEDDEHILLHGNKVPEKLIEIENNNVKHFISFAKYPALSENEITGLIGIGRNLTELKQAEKKIIESEANLNALIESSQDFIWSIDSKYRLITFNSAFSRYIKANFEIELTARDNMVNIFPNDLKNFWEKAYEKAIKGEQHFEELSITSRNVTLYFECSFNPIFDKSLNVSGVSVILTDISERKLAEHAIRESEERFRQLAENTSDSFILWDSTGVLYANPAFEKIFGVSVEETMNTPSLIEEMIAEEDRLRFVRNRKKEANGKQKPRNQHYLLKKRNRKPSKLIWARHFPVYNHKGKIYRYVTVTSDLTEQKQLEEVLTKTRSQQQALLDNIPFLAWLKDRNGRYISVNTPFASHYNLKIEDIIGKMDIDVLPEPEALRSSEADKQVIQSGKRVHFEVDANTDNGTVWKEIYKSPIFNEKGNVIGLTGISREITDRKLLEETIIKNEEHFKALLQYSSDAITILDKDGRITFESSLRNRILNFPIEELIGKPFKDIIHPDDTYIFENAFNESLLNPGIQIKKEYRSLHKNKRWIYVESIFSNHLGNPSISGIVVNTRDVSDRKMSELKERAYHNNLIFLSNSALELLSISDREDIYKFIADKLFHFLEHAVILVSSYIEERDSFIIKQASGLEQYQNQVKKILGRSPVGVIYKRSESNLQFENAGSINIVKDLESYIQSSEKQMPAIKEALEYLNANKIYTITLARNNKLLGCIGIITLNKTIIKFKHIIETFAHQVAVALHRSQLEYELISAKLKAEESDRLKTAFLANMSHEIRTPMNGILGFAEMLNDESIADTERRKYIDVINNNGKILINLIDDIIDFAKIEAGQTKIVNHEFSLNTLLDQINNTFLGGDYKKEKNNVELRLEKGLMDENGYIRSDPIRLRQILTNLISNSFKFTNTGYIEFGYSLRNDKFLEFYVEDTGIGIPAEKLKIIFERFVQADNSRSRKYSGSGLGLAISKGLSELLGGQMWAISEVGKGSKFCFSIPYQKAKFKKKEDSGEKKPKSTYNWSDKNILVAEDDFFSYKFLEGFLKQTKANVLHAEDGQKAVNICSDQQNIDVVLMDVQMPEMNGLDATKNIKKFRPELPIIAQTANAIAEEKQKCFEAGFDDFVTKPINISELFMKIEHWMIKSLNKDA